ncbi:cerebellin 17 isoform X1 [Salminus brasiliensis]|uniref:cerebellin 17 isoform X1 n=1 Tax=Salminus brasiliensis TaxID=930266 RepID=UPI003B83997C
MRVSSVVLLFFSLSCAELQRGDGQLSVEDLQSSLNRLQNQSRAERPELLTDQTTVQPDVWTELRELRNMVVDQRVQLASTQCQIEELKKENAAVKNHMAEMKQGHAALAGRVTYAELGLEALRDENANTQKVAFSFGSGLSGHLGPFDVDTLLVFSKEFTNVGNAYSPITGGDVGTLSADPGVSLAAGIFTAPVRGVYFFRLNIFGYTAPHWIGAELFKNQEKIFFLSEFPDGVHEYASNSVTLLLEKGDLVYVKLKSGRNIFDNTDNHCTFSGFLLFPM